MTAEVDSENPRLDCFLVGAPGAGKSAIAKAFQDRTKTWFEEKGMKPLVVLDGLPQALAEDAGIQLGAYGNYYDTATIWHHAEVRRDRTRRTGRPFLDTQSLISTLAHANARINVMGQLVMTPELQMNMQRELMSGTVLTNYLPERWAPMLNFGWYVPLPEQIIVPGRNQETFPVAVDAVIRDMNVKLGLGLPVLEGTLDQKVQAMIDDFEKYYVFPTEDAEDTAAVQ